MSTEIIDPVDYPNRLDTRIPEKGFGDADEMLDAFLEWAADKGLELYTHQEEAVLELFAGSHVVLDTPTGSGKSLVATALHFKTFAETGRTFYTAPIKALVSEKFFDLCKLFGAEHVGMMTGDASVNRDAPIICCTAEILANIAMREGNGARVDSVVMDEFHYYADRDRGMAWQVPLLTLPQAQCLLMSATLGDTTLIREDLEATTGRTAAEVVSRDRPVPLDFSYSERPLHDAVSSLVNVGKAPLYVVHFTQREAAEHAQSLMSTNFCSKEEKKAIKAALKGVRFDSPYGGHIQRYLFHGVGLHHAGMLPRYRRAVERVAQQGLLKVICGTDTLGVGINVPIRAVLFTKLCKYDGESVDILKVRDFQQIAGRAGRAGYDTEGFVIAQAPEWVIANQILSGKASDGRHKKKVKKQSAPNRGYKHWTKDTFEKLTSSRPEALESRFKVTHDNVLSLMQHAEETGGKATEGVARMHELVDRAHTTRKQTQFLHERTDEVVAQLEQVGIATRDEEGELHVDSTLQMDFSLHHALSLYLVDSIGALDHEAEDHVLNVLTMVESILEDPRPVLYRLAHKARGELINKLKADGVPYEERMEAIEDVSWPKPMAELIYAHFNSYAEKHPWVSGEAIRPKSVVRDMIERYASFPEYVRELGLERVEGVLLRYLSDAFKALIQNVPAEEQTDELLDVIAFLRATIGRVDASLVAEWEALRSGVGGVGEQEAAPVDISADPRSFRARIRAELHMLVRSLAMGAFDEVIAGVHPDSRTAGGWTAAKVESAIAPLLDEFGVVAFDHRARLGHRTRFEKVGPHQWEVSQSLVGPMQLDPDGDDHLDTDGDPDETGWAITGRIDLREDTNPEGALLRLLSIEGA